jgi:hypothetical protein
MTNIRSSTSRGKEGDRSDPPERGPQGPVTEPNDPGDMAHTGEGSADTASRSLTASALPKSWEAQLRQLFREEIEQVLTERLPAELRTIASRSEPPVPGDQSLRRVERCMLPQMSVDAVLLDLFDKECARHGESANRAMEYILWNFFGKPSLSFEVMERFIESRSQRTGAVCLEDTVDY